MIRTSHCLLASSLLFASVARADPRELARALELYESGELAGSLAVFERVLAAGGNDAEAMRTIYVHLGVLRAGAGDTEGAVQAFRALLSLDPSAQPPPDVSPVILDPFAAAKSARGDAPPLGIVVADEVARREVGETHTVTGRVIGDSEGLVRAVRAEIVRGRAAGARVEPTGTEPLRFDFPSEATAESGDFAYRIDLLDAHGSTLASEGPRTVSIFAPREAATPAGSIFGSPIFWAGAGAVVVGAILVGVLASGGSGKATVGSAVFE